MSDDLHSSLRDVPMPERLRRLPVDERGFPVPFFVAIVDGKPDHRVVDHDKLKRAVTGKLCWLCGEHLGAHRAFVIGPMCSITRTSAEPPSHRDCALYAVQACPFLTRPHAKRRPADFAHVPAAGEMLLRNPGACAVWVTKFHLAQRAQGGQTGVLFSIGDPTEVTWWAEGRPATRAEIEESVRTGLPLLEQHAPSSRELESLRREAMLAQRYWPQS